MPNKSIPQMTTEQEERFWAKVDVHQPAGCWEWIGAHDQKGYGMFKIGQSMYRAHRVSSRELIGIAPVDLEADHLCRNTRCVNPDHIQFVTRSENIRTSYSASGLNGRKTHCIHGHEFTAENTGIELPTGKRWCRTCKRSRRRIA